MSMTEWKRFVHSAKRSTLKKFGKHVTKLVDSERNKVT